MAVIPHSSTAALSHCRICMSPPVSDFHRIIKITAFALPPRANRSGTP